MKGHWKVHKCMWKNFERICEVAIQKNAFIINEWPDRCMYYGLPRVRAWFEKHRFESVIIDGCMTGLTSINAKDFGLPILKTFRLMTNKPEYLEPMRRAFRCDHKCHARCEGRNTKMTETYTREFCRIAHLCFFKYICEVKHIEKFPKWMTPPLLTNNVDVCKNRPPKAKYTPCSDNRTLLNHNDPIKVSAACPIEVEESELCKSTLFSGLWKQCLPIRVQVLHRKGGQDHHPHILWRMMRSDRWQALADLGKKRQRPWHRRLLVFHFAGWCRCHRLNKCQLLHGMPVTRLNDRSCLDLILCPWQQQGRHLHRLDRHRVFLGQLHHLAPIRMFSERNNALLRPRSLALLHRIHGTCWNHGILSRQISQTQGRPSRRLRLLPIPGF